MTTDNPTLASSTRHIELQISGMRCASCAATIERSFAQLPGVEEATVNFALGSGEVVTRSGGPQGEELQKLVTSLGYSAKVVSGPGDDSSKVVAQEDDSAQVEVQNWWWRFVVATAGSVLLVGLHFLPHSFAATAVGLVIATAVQGYVGASFVWSALKQLRHRIVSMDALVGLATTAAYLAGVGSLFATHASHSMELMDGAMILAFISLGKYLELRARARASQAATALLKMLPETSVVERGGKTITIATREIIAGDTVLVAAGERIPVDGTIVQGHGDVTESWLSGEPLPVTKGVGDLLFAGTVLGDSAFTMKATQPAAATWLAKMAEQVRHLQATKMGYHRLADRVVARFVPVVLLIALATFLFWVWQVPNDWSPAIRHAVAVLVVACPCALGLATPVAVLVASGKGAENGILFKDAAAIEQLAQAEVLFLDKTGTITWGEPKVLRVEAASGVKADELVSIAAQIERHSRHPIAKAIVSYAQENVETKRAADAGLEMVSVTNLAGGGLVASTNRGELLAGNAGLLESKHVSRPMLLVGLQMEQKKQSEIAVHFALAGKYLGQIVLADQIAEGSQIAVRELKQLGLRPVLLSGDRSSTAQEIAAQMEIEEVIAQALPEDKRKHLEAARQQGKVTVMVGDGANDALAMGAADVAVALSTGIDLAVESAQVVLAKHDLRLLASAIRLGRGTVRIIRQNLFWAMGYNVVLIPLAAGLFQRSLDWDLSPTVASIAMAASSVLVVMNSLRLRGMRLTSER